MRSGVYGLASLDGAPISSHDRSVLFAGLQPVSAQDCLLAGRDARLESVHVHQGLDGLDVLLGDLDEAGDLRRRPGPQVEANDAALAAAAHDRWAVEAPARLAGEWLLVRWSASSRTLTLSMSECLRDPCHFATDGRRVAIAPDLIRLARLEWIGSVFDPDMVMRAMGRHPLRRTMGNRTILAGVSTLLPGMTVTIGPTGVRTETTTPSAPPRLMNISFDDAMAETEALLRAGMRRDLARWRHVAVMLSGGLDSSLLAWLSSEERREGQSVTFLTSASPAGSGIEDETRWAEMVMEHVGAPLVRVAPAASANVYLPAARAFEAAQTPLIGPRHYLYAALEDAAISRGATAMVDGAFGELTLSNHGFCLDTPTDRLRRTAQDMLSSARGVFRPASLGDSFHVQAASSAIVDHFRGVRPDDFKESVPRRLKPTDPLGFEDGGEKTAAQPSASTDPALRYLRPFRDRQLLQRFAGYPASFVLRDGMSRAPVRALLRGRLPDVIARRTSKMAFSPTHDHMLRTQAGEELDRLADQRAAGADEWLDMDWLERSLIQVRDAADTRRIDRFKLQATAGAAEFFRWWRAAVTR